MLRIVFTELRYIRSYLLLAAASILPFFIFITKYISIKGSNNIDPEVIYLIVFWAIAATFGIVIIPLQGKTTEKRQKLLVMLPVSGFQLGLARLLPLIIGTASFLLIWIVIILSLQIEIAVKAVWIAISTYNVWMYVMMKIYVLSLMAHRSAILKRISVLLAWFMLLLTLLIFFPGSLQRLIFGDEYISIRVVELVLNPAGALGLTCLTVTLYLIALYLLKDKMSYLEFKPNNYNPLLGRMRY